VCPQLPSFFFVSSAKYLPNQFNTGNKQRGQHDPSLSKNRQSDSTSNKNTSNKRTLRSKPASQDRRLY
jgi:hypothetical protein